MLNGQVDCSSRTLRAIQRVHAEIVGSSADSVQVPA
ncbi:hypothetical protein [Burkholderia multivorans]